MATVEATAGALVVQAVQETEVSPLDSTTVIGFAERYAAGDDAKLAAVGWMAESDGNYARAVGVAERTLYAGETVERE